MKVIFLDFDGVFIIPRTMRHSGSRSVADPECVSHLNRIIRETRARIVLSTAWRGRYVAPLQRKLRAWGVKGTVVGSTPRHLDRLLDERRDITDFCRRVVRIRRGDEIREWLQTRGRELGVTSYVILDDGRDMRHLWRRLVQTDFQVGLTAEHATKAIALLEGYK